MSVLLPEELDCPFIEVTLRDHNQAGFLPDNEVHIWLIPVGPVSPDLLLEPERERADRFHQQSDANRFSSARVALRRLAGAYLEIAAAEVQITGAQNEKPVIGNNSLRPLHFSVSHSGGLALVAFSRHPIGVDLEFIDSGFEPRELLESQFHESEQEAITLSADPISAFYLLWTRKEALIKALGTGLNDGLNELPVLQADISPLAKAGFTRLLSFKTLPGYAASLCTGKETEFMRFYREP